MKAILTDTPHKNIAANVLLNTSSLMILVPLRLLDGTLL